MRSSLRPLLILAVLALPARAEQGSLAAALQPFVDQHTVAGAVVLVASKDRVLDLETVGYADLEAKKPMANPQRMAWPGGGLFSTAEDVARFCQMFLNHGLAGDGKRVLSEASVQAMTQKQTGDAVKESYGFGWNANATVFVHSGAFRTEMRVNKEKGLISVFLVQVNGEWPNNGKDIMPAFLKAADAFAPVLTK